MSKHLPLGSALTALRAGLCLAACAGLAACETAPPPSVGIAALMERPGEHALAAGLVDYDDGAFDRAETDFRNAVARGLKDPVDVSVAYKHLAFIACAFNRPMECEANFRSAFAANADFHLTETEIGHPVWGPVYRRVAAAQAPAAAPGAPGSAAPTR